MHRKCYYYSASALLAMQSAVITIASVHLSVCPSVTFRCFVKKNKHTIMQFSVSGRTITLISEEVKFIRMFAGDHPNEGVKVKCSLSLAKI